MKPYTKLKRGAVIGSTMLCSIFAQAQDTVPLTASKKSEHFSTVASQLEVGGTRFSYTDGAATTGMIKTCLDLVMQAYGDTLLDGVDQAKMEGIFKLGAVKASGSSVTDQGEFYHYRTFNYMPEEKSMWSQAYGDSNPSVAMQYAPAGTDLVLEIHIDGKSSTQIPELIDALGPRLGGMYKNLMEQQRQENDWVGPYQDYVTKMDSRIALIVDLLPEGYEEIPRSPVSGQALLTITNSKDLWTSFKPFLEKEMPIQKNDQGEFIEVPDELMPDIRPVLQYDAKNEQLFVSTSRKYLDQCMEVKGNGLNKDPVFTKLGYGLPDSYANMVYVSPDVSKLLINLADTFLAMQESDIPAEVMPAITTVMKALKDSPIQKTGSLYVVNYGDKGTLHVANTPLFIPEQNIAVTTGAGLMATSTLFVGAQYYKKGADEAACKVNINGIQKATRSLQNIMNHKTGDELTWDMFVGEDMPLPVRPTCPAGGTYTLSPTFPKKGEPACRCSHPEHNFTKEETRNW